MAYSGEPTVFAGNPDWYPGDPISFIPDADLYPQNTNSYPGGFIRVDGTLSASQDDLDVLYYDWEITKSPQASSVGSIATSSLFEQRYTLKTETTGIYEIGLRVWGAAGGVSTQSKSLIVSLVRNSAYSNQISLDVSWVWQNLPSFWSDVPADDRGRIELLWRGIQQLISADLLSAYNVDDGKSITTIQQQRFARWISIPMSIDISQRTAVLMPMFTLSGEWLGSSLMLDVDPPWLAYPSARLTGTILSTTSVATFGSEGIFSPQESDSGRTITISVDGFNITRRIVFVTLDIYTVGRSAIYSLDAPIPAAHIGKGVSISVDFTTPEHIVVESNGEVGRVISYRGGVLKTTLTAPQGAVRTLSYIELPDANALGVTRGDSVIVDIIYQGSSRATSVRLIVVGVIPDIATASGVVDLVAVSPVSGNYVETVSEVLTQVSTDYDQDLAFLSGPMSPLVWSGVRWGTEQRLVIPSGGSYQSVLISLRAVLLRKRVAAPADTLSIPSLTEFIEYHDAFEDGIISDAGRALQLGRPPIKLIENVHYTISGGIIVLDTSLPEPTPRTLWAETAVIDNSDTLEKNFGSLLNLSRSAWESISDGAATYRSALMGLYVARMLGATIDNIQRATGILTGIPFADEPVLITEIDPAYEIDTVTAEPLVARVVVEALTDAGERTGVLRSFEVGLNRSSTDPLMSGLALGRSGRIAPGDVLERFQLMGCGVAVEDILTRGESSAFYRNRFRVRVDVESTTLSHGIVKLVHSTLVDIKPAYTDILLTLYRFVSDRINITATMSAAVRAQLIDVGSYIHMVADVYDDYAPGYQRVDIPTYNTLTTWFPSDGRLRVVDGELILSTATGGMVAPSRPKVIYSDHRRGSIKVGYTEDMHLGSGAWVSNTDYVLFRSRDISGMYAISDVLSDTELRLSPISPSGDSMPIAEGDGLSFCVVRLTTDIVFDGLILESGSQGIKIVRLGAVNNGIAAGDEVSFPEFGLSRRPVLAVRETQLEDGHPAVFVSVDQPPSLLTQEISAGSRVVVRRPRVRRRARGTYELTRSLAGLHCFSLNTSGLFGAAASGLDRGDIVTFSSGEETDILATFGDLMWLRSSPDGDVFTVTIRDMYGVGVGDDFDLTERSVISTCSVIIKHIGSYRGGRGVDEYTSSLYVEPVAGREVRLVDAEGNPSTSSARAGDLLRVVDTSVSRYKGDAGQGCFRVAESGAQSVRTAEPIPFPADVDRLPVAVIRQSKNVANYWRRL